MVLTFTYLHYYASKKTSVNLNVFLSILLVDTPLTIVRNYLFYLQYYEKHTIFDRIG